MDKEQSLILIVDDNKNDLQILGNILREAGYKIAATANGTDALEFVGKKNPDLILLDVKMPDIDGYEVCRRIKAIDGSDSVPVIFISAMREAGDVLKGFETGGVDYITKPFTKDEVLARVNAHLTIFRQKKKLDKLNRDLSEINRTKDKFFSIIAHDLKNPLGSFKNVTGFMLNNFPELGEGEKIEFLNLMNDSAQHVYSLLENLLNWSRSQTGKLEFNPVKVDLKILAAENISLIKMNADKKDIAIINEINERTNVFADPNMVSTIIRNLITNAVKFTHKGGEVVISSKKKGNFVEVTVKDSGIGMNEDISSKLFNMKAHHSTKGTEEEGGTGLGLILCKEFVERHGGSIWVESEVDKGSSFRFTLPVRETKNN